MAVVPQRRVHKQLILVWLLAIVLVACERPFQPDSDVAEAPTQEVTDATDVNVESAQTTETPESVAITPTEETQTTEGETPRVEGETPVETEETTETTTTTEGETPQETTTETTTEETVTEETATESTTETTTEETAPETTTETTTTPDTTTNAGTHTVAAGETLYLIGLQYGVSWVTLAEFNDLSNPNQLTVGQTINIPSAAPTTPTAEPTPSPLTETIYTVKAGDNLFRIGLAYGISWVQIAEANGIVNPNQLTVGQTIKIPMEAPGPTPQFTHQVKAGETLFRIALQYGVSWTAVAERNNIGSPYIIYAGQTLVIPGG